MDKTTLYLPPELNQALRDIARRTGRAEDDVIRAALQAYLEQQSRPSLRSLGVVNNPDVSAADDEAWLRAHWRPA